MKNKSKLYSLSIPPLQKYTKQQFNFGQSFINAAVFLQKGTGFGLQRLTPSWAFEVKSYLTWDSVMGTNIIYLNCPLFSTN